MLLFHYAIFIISLVFLVGTYVNAEYTESANLTVWRQERHRQKRFLIFPKQGVCKFVVGLALPVVLEDRSPWRSLTWTVNFQFQYAEPLVPWYWWEKFKTRKMPFAPLALSDQKAVEEAIKKSDEPQMFLYQFVEETMNRKGIDGHACLQRSICENAQIHENLGLFSELLGRFLIPHPSLNPDYIDAHRMGRHGANCLASFPKAKNCIFDQFIQLRDDKFE